MELPPKELVIASACDSSRILPLLTRGCSLECSTTLLRVTEPLEDRMEHALFSPSLSKQRVDYALQHIKDSCATSLVDFGCASGSLLDSLLALPTSLEKLVPIDISQKGLARAAKVIKYMEEDEAHLFGDTVLSSFCPRILIVSTPNYEYNVILQGSNLQSQEEDPDDKTHLFVSSVTTTTSLSGPESSSADGLPTSLQGTTTVLNLVELVEPPTRNLDLPPRLLSSGGKKNASKM